MYRSTSLVAAAFVFAGLAFADPRDVGGPAGPDGGFQKGDPDCVKKGNCSGYQIRGCANHDTVGAVTKQVCNTNNVRDAKEFYEARDRYGAGTE